jgi:cytochrome P450
VDEARANTPPTGNGANYLEAACREALRMHPPHPFALRRAREPVVIGDCRIPPGTYVAPSMFLAHHRPDVYPEPGRFRPDRYLERTYSPWEFLPFGGGNRRCIGDVAALRQMVVVLSALLRGLDLAPLRTYELTARRRAITLHPRDPLPVRFQRVGVGGIAASS